MNLVTDQHSKRTWAIRVIVCFGFVSLFADMTYEGARSITGPFLQSLGASAAIVGFIAGFGEMLAAGLRYFWGKLADKTRGYWTLSILGYCLTMAAVPAMAFAGNWKIAALLIVAERTGKSIRGPARDVLMSQATNQVGHGWGFGLHAAMDQAGAVAGPLWVALALARAHDFHKTFLQLAFPVAGAALGLVAAFLIFRSRGQSHPEPPSAAEQHLPEVFRRYVVAAALLAFGFADFALLAFHFQATGVVSATAIPLLYAGAMAVNGITALLFGRLFDRLGIPALVVGIAISAAAPGLAFLGGGIGAVAGVICWGTGMGAQDACLRAGIAKVVSMNKRGSAFGAFSGVYGVAWFLGSATMGLLYSASMPALVLCGTVAQASAAVLFFRLRHDLKSA